MVAGTAALVVLGGMPAVDRVVVVFLVAELAATMALAVVAAAVLRTDRQPVRRSGA
jgi:hypothetical protein